MPVIESHLPSVDVSKIRCLAFDAVGTLIFAEPSVAAVYASIGQQFGSRVTAEEIGPRFREAMTHADNEAERWFGELGRTNEDYEREFWRRIVRDVLPDVGDAERCFETLFEHFSQPRSWRCFEDVGATLTELQGRGYRVLVASNFDARLHRVCDGLRELRDVRSRVISSLIGYRKTHPGFYTAVVDTAECDASEVLMIGDDFENDVVSAQKAGIAAVHLQRDANVGESRSDSHSSHGMTRLLGSLSDLLEWLP